MATVTPPRVPLSIQYRNPDAHRDWTDAAARIGKIAIQAAAPVDTGPDSLPGLLKQSIRSGPVTSPLGPTVRYWTRVDFAMYQEVGTGLYGPLHKWITPTVAKALTWIADDGRRVFAKRSAGSKPQYYFRDGMYATFGRKNVRYYGATGR